VGREENPSYSSTYPNVSPKEGKKKSTEEKKKRERKEGGET